ncbi:MAG TPA: DHH family phosphoesterase, partial [bacterium]|nr:DHH family phosphoesterase [bacterium]
MNHWKQITDIIDGHQRFLIVSHQYPDGDASGSCLGLLHYLCSLGKQSRCVNCSPIQKVLEFLDPERVHQVYDKNTFDWSWPEVVFILDTSDVKRLGPVGDDLPWDRVISVNIDHHRSSSEAIPASVSQVDA